MQIAINGALCAADAAVISVYDHGFLYGMGLFETFRTYDGRPFLLEQHLARLAAGCLELGIHYVPNRTYVEELVGQLLAANGLTDAYFRLSLSAGVDLLGLPGDMYYRPTEILYIKPLPAPAIDKTLQLLTTPRNTPEGEIRLKSFHYMNAILGKRELARYPWAQAAEGLFLDDCGFVAEGITSNVFFVAQGALHTPALETCILPGITRDWVIGAAEKLGIPVEEGFYSWEAVLEADEVFITNSIQEIVPVTRLYDAEGNYQTLSSFGPETVTGKLLLQYGEAVRFKGGV